MHSAKRNLASNYDRNIILSPFWSQFFASFGGGGSHTVTMALSGQAQICILWQELSHWPSMLSRENTSTGQGHVGLIRAPPAIIQQVQCIVGEDGNGCHAKASARVTFRRLFQLD